MYRRLTVGLLLAVSTLLQGAFVDAPAVGMLDTIPAVTMAPEPAAAAATAVEPTVADDVDASVPEPATLAMIGMGLIGLSMIGRRRQRS